MRDLQLRLQPHHPLSDWQQQRPDLAFVTVEGSGLRALLHRLREEEGFTHLVLLTAVDWLEEGEFQLTYLLCSRRHGYDLGVRVVIDRDQAAMVSVHDLWPTAATYQRELREMFGIDFPGSPGVDESFILEGWQEIPPYRRDFDTLAFAERSFNHRPGRESHDPATHMRRRLEQEGGW
jgi:NADH-quinone oxidoreductase subunit C